MQNVEVSIKEIVVNLLRKWKMIVLVALVFAIAFVAFTYTKQAVTRGKQQEAISGQNGAYVINMAIELTSFVGTSPDSYHITLASNDLYTKLQNRYFLLAEGATIEDLLGNEVPAGLTKDEYIGIVSVTAPSVGILEIAARKNALIDPKIAAQAMREYLLKSNEVVTKSVTDHNLLLLSEVTVTSRMAEVKSTFSLSALIGFIVGMILSVVILTFSYLINPSIQTPERIKNTTGMGYLGGVLHSNQKTPSGMLAGTMRMAPKDEGIELVIENMREFLDDKQNVLFTGTVKELLLQDVIQKIADKLDRDDLTIHYGTDINGNADTIRKLVESDAVVLVERLNYSKLKNVFYEKERIEMSGKPILGYMLY